MKGHKCFRNQAFINKLCQSTIKNQLLGRLFRTDPWYRTCKSKDDEFDQNENNGYEIDDCNHNKLNYYSNIKDKANANKVPIHAQDSEYVN